MTTSASALPIPSTARNVIRKPFPYYGSKGNQTDWLTPLLPPHDCYVEVCGGSGALLFAKRPAPIEVFNDLDGDLVTFFRVLRDPEKAEALRAMLELTPYARAEWRAARGLKPQSEVEQAWRWFVLAHQSFAGRIDRRTGWRYAKDPGHNPAHSFAAAIAELPTFTRRLRTVQVECRDFEPLLRAYDSPKTLFFIDPPYLLETRSAHDVGYKHEMTDADHQRLLAAVCAVKGMVVLCGYSNRLYNRALAEWDKRDFDVTLAAARVDGQKRAGRTERVWRNPACLAAEGYQSLWEGLTT